MMRLLLFAWKAERARSQENIEIKTLFSRAKHAKHVNVEIVYCEPSCAKWILVAPTLSHLKVLSENQEIWLLFLLCS